MKTVKRTDLKKLVYAVFRLFQAQDEEHIDGRTVAAREMAVNRCLEKISYSKEEQAKIRNVAEYSLWTWRVGETLEKQMREMGYEIEEEKEE